MYSVSDAAEMLNVNEETIRRWIRSEKLQAKRAVGRGGNTLYLEDIIAFANQPPRAYLLSLEVWLTEHGIPYEKIEDSTNASEALTGATGIAASAAGALLGGPVGLGIAGLAYGASQLTKRKNYQKYAIRLATADESDSSTTVKTDCSHAADRAVAKDYYVAKEYQVAEDRIIPKEHISAKALLSKDTLDPQSLPTSATDHTEAQGIPSAASPFNVLSEIASAKQLLDAGVITAEEFADIKARLIAKI